MKRRLLLALTLQLLAPAAYAQTIPNPSFEIDHYNSGVGYASQNSGVITDWTVSDPTRIGLNVGGSNNPGFFANNGAIPDGTNVAFIQSNGATNSLSTTISNLVPGRAYQVMFRANCRGLGYTAPVTSWSLNGGAFVPFTCDPPVGGANPYYTNSGAFVATDSSAALALRNGGVVGDGTVLLDNFTVGQILVVSNANDSGVGSLRQAVLDAAMVAGTPTITFAPALNGQTIILTSGQIVLNTNLTIDASGLASGIAISGNGTSGVFHLYNAAYTPTVVMNGLTITNGSYAFGGGIFNDHSTVTLNQCTLAGNGADNSAYGGGGIFNNYGNATLNQCTLYGNHANNGSVGGGVFNYAGLMHINQSTISSNGSASGGGIYNQGTLTVSNAIVAGNSGGDLVNLDIYSASGVNVVGGNPQLAPLGNYGGPTPTMPPLPGSPAIDACTNGTGFATDQRGYPRIVGHYADIGAVEANWTNVVVTTTADSGPDSLRDIATYFPAGSDVTFATNLSGSTITLTGGPVVLSNSVTIDGSALATAVKINGNHASRIFSINNGATVTLNSLVLTNGYASSSYGGAISNSPGATAMIQKCLVVSCTADLYGGGILNSGTLTLLSSTLAANHAGNFGGGINNDGTLFVNQCTLAGNSAGTGGGGISSSGQVRLVQSTLSANLAGSYAGGIHSGGAGTLVLSNAVVAGNSAPSSPDVDITYSGTAYQVGGNPLLATLGYYGGPTPTMPPLPGSSLVNAGSDTVAGNFATDQRGFPRLAGAHVDIGAVEVQSPATNPPVLKNVAHSAAGGSTFQLTFTNTLNSDFTVLTSTNTASPLANWTVLGEVMQTTPGQYQFSDPQTTNAQRFYRIVSP